MTVALPRRIFAWPSASESSSEMDLSGDVFTSRLLPSSPVVLTHAVGSFSKPTLASTGSSFFLLAACFASSAFVQDSPIAPHAWLYGMPVSRTAGMSCRGS